MAERLVKFIWLESKSQLPVRLELDAVYYIAKEALIIIDHGNGAVEFGGSQSVNTLDGDETDKSPTVHAVKQALAEIDQGLYRGTFNTAADLAAAYPTDKAGAYAIVLATGTTWVWSGTEWTDTGKKPEQTVIIDNLTTPDADKALSANQGVVLKQLIDTKSSVEIIDNLTTPDADKALSAKQGVEIKRILDNKASCVIINLVIPASDWVRDDTDVTGWPYYLDIANSIFDKDMSPHLSIKPESLRTAINAGFCPAMSIFDGELRVYSANIPAEDLRASLMLITAESVDIDGSDTASPEDIDGIVDNMYPDD